MKNVIKTLIVLILIFLISSVYIGYNIYSFANNEVKKSDGILVLGCRVRGETPSVSLQRRMETALDLYNEGYGRKIILSGGQGDGEDITEAEAMRRYFVSQKVDERNLIIEDKSTTTYENIEFSKKFMDKENINSIIIVSNGYHLKRASSIAEKFNIDATYKGFVLKDYPSVELQGFIREILATYKNIIVN